jgi:hypothetical protein
MVKTRDDGKRFRVAVRKCEVPRCERLRANFELGSVAISLLFASLVQELFRRLIGRLLHAIIEFPIVSIACGNAGRNGTTL